MADLYASHEAMEGADDSLDTSELDAALTFGQDAYLAAVEAGMFKLSFFGSMVASTMKTRSGSWLDWKAREKEQLYNVGTYAYDKDIQTSHRAIIQSLQSVSGKDNYLHTIVEIRDIWLYSFIQRGSRWAQLSDERKLEIATTLTEQIVEYMRATTNGFIRPTNAVWDRAYRPLPQLLEEVGLPLP